MGAFDERPRPRRGHRLGTNDRTTRYSAVFAANRCDRCRRPARSPRPWARCANGRSVLGFDDNWFAAQSAAESSTVWQDTGTLGNSFAFQPSWLEYGASLNRPRTEFQFVSSPGKFRPLSTAAGGDSAANPLTDLGNRPELADEAAPVVGRTLADLSASSRKRDGPRTAVDLATVLPWPFA